MKFAPVPAYERERLKALNDYCILDTMPESDFDDITDMASMICNVPIALISFIDANRQWFKSHRGLARAVEISRDDSFVTYAIDSPDEILIVNNLSDDERFSSNPFVTGSPHVLFYAGVSLISPEGYVVGTLSVLDVKPNDLEPKQVTALQALGKQVITLLELRKKTRLIAQKQIDLNLAQTDLEQIAFLASHDLKTPLNNILSLVDLLQTEYGKALGSDGNEYIQYVSEAASVASGMITGILVFSRAAKLPVKKEHVNLDQIINDIKYSLDIPVNTTINVIGDGKNIHASGEILRQILFQLLKNAIQYGLKSRNEIEVVFREEKSNYTFEVKDEGEGIEEADKENAFILFKRLKNREKTAENMGVGLAIVKRLIEKIGGDITINANSGEGTTFTFSFPK